MSKVVHCKKSEYDVYIGRPSKWGNHFIHEWTFGNATKIAKRELILCETREEAISKYKEWILSNPKLIEQIKKELKGKVLGCWCYPRTCHGDILVEIANG